MDETPKPAPPPGRKAAKRPKALAPPPEEKSDRQVQDEYVAGRLDAWVAAHQALKARGYDLDPDQTRELAEFLTGDHI